MANDYTVIVEPAKDVKISVKSDKITVQGKKTTNERSFDLKGITLKMDGDKLVVSTPTSKRLMKAKVGTISAHVRNMVQGVANGFEYKLTVFYSHFPVSIAQVGAKVVIKNFLGEKYPREANIIGKDTKVEIKGQDITVKGCDLEAVSQTAANMEKATRITNRDLRIFNDGIFIVSKDER